MANLFQDDAPPALPAAHQPLAERLRPRLLADAVGLRYHGVSAVFTGVAELKKVFAEAREHARRPPGAAVRGRDLPLECMTGPSKL